MIRPVLPLPLALPLPPNPVLSPVKTVAIIVSLKLMTLGTTQLIWPDSYTLEKKLIRLVGCTSSLAIGAAFGFPWGPMRAKLCFQVFTRSVGSMISGLTALSSTAEFQRTNLFALAAIPITFLPELIFGDRNVW